MRYAPVVLVALAVALTGCQTTAQRSAKLEREALRNVAKLGRGGLVITRPSTQVRVISTAVLHNSEGAAAVVVLRNLTGHALGSVPLALTVIDARGRTLYENNATGLEAALVAVPSIPPHGEVAWIDDQLSATGQPVAASARLGEAQTVAALPRLTVAGAHATEEGSVVGAAGTVRNSSQVNQGRFVLYGVARRGGRIVAAGRGAVPQLAAGASAPFQLFFVGDPHGAQLEVLAPASTLR